MAKVKLNLIGLTIAERIQFAKRIVTAMTGNSDFPSPQPTLADITAGADDLQTAFNDAKASRDTAKTLTSKQADNESALNKLLTRLGSHVENVSEGDEAKILSTGMDVRDSRAPVGDMLQPDNLSATVGDKSGEIDLDWDSVRGARSYVVHKSANTPDNFADAGHVTKSKFTVSELESGVKYWFRVAAVGSAGQGPWSDPATKFVP